MYRVIVCLAAGVVVGVGVPSWVALGAGLAIALLSGVHPPPVVRRATNLALQLGVVALGAGMNLVAVGHVGASGALLTAVTLAAALLVGLGLGKLLRVGGNTPLLVSVGTAICGGSAIAAMTSVLAPDEEETSVSLAVVFILNAVGLVLFPALGHALGLSEPVFGRWAALGIHDTSSVIGAGLAYGPVALEIATTTKLARALWIVPITIIAALVKRRGPGLGAIRWPWFILGFVAVAALFTWVPVVAPAASIVVAVGHRALLLALFLIGLSLSRAAILRVGVRPLVLGIALWIVLGSLSLWLATLAA